MRVMAKQVVKANEGECCDSDGERANTWAHDRWVSGQ